VTNLRAALLLPLAAAALAAGPAGATTACLDWLEDIHDTSSSCLSTPSIPRYLMSHVVAWGTTSYYVVDNGNELQFYDIGIDPADPVHRHTTSFGIPNQGDSDYDLETFSVCDGCRFGTASYKLGLVVFDTGAGAHPNTASFSYYEGLPKGAYTFAARGRQYLVTRGLLDACPGNGSSVYEILPAGGGVALSRVACAQLPGDALFQPAGGVSMEVAGEHYLYLAKTSSPISVFRVVPNGSQISLEYVDVGGDPRLRATMSFGKGMSYDADRNLLATAYPTRGLTLWDVADPAHPQVVWSDPGLAASRVALEGRFLHATGGSIGDVYSFDISDPSAPAALDSGFWLPDTVWNANCYNGTNYDAVFHPTEEILYAARFARDQVFDYGACGTGLLAGLTVASDPPAHSQPIVLDNLSAAPPGASLTLDWDVLAAGGGALVDALAGCDGPGAVDDGCVVPAGTLLPGERYRFQLRVTRTGTGDTSYSFVESVVAYGGPDLVVSALPATPEIGQMVVFTISGVSDLEQVSWDFGGPGCPPFNSSSACWPTQFDDCLSAGYQYASAGATTAAATVRIDGVDYGPYQVVVDVAAAGACPCLVDAPQWDAAADPAAVVAGEPVELEAWATGGGPADTTRWRIERNGVPVASSENPVFEHTFASPGRHRAVFEARNCDGADVEELELAVLPAPELEYSAASGHGAHTAPRAAAVLGDALLVGTSGPPDGGGLFRRSPGGVWTAAMVGGFGSAANTAVSALAVFGGELWAGTENEAAGAELWRSADGTAWAPAQTGGFGDPLNVEIAALAVHDGALFAATRSATGAEVWRSADGDAWSQVNADGFGSSANQAPGGLASFGGRLYATVAGDDGAEVWRRVAGTTWEPSGAGGFGSAANEAAAALAVHGGALFAGTANPAAGAEVWRSADGTAWVQAASGGFGDPAGNDEVRSLASEPGALFAGTAAPVTGAEVWATEDGGSSWQPWLLDGLGDPASGSVAAMVVLGGELYAAVGNPAGFRVWRTDLPGPAVFGDGFESGATTGWSDTVAD